MIHGKFETTEELKKLSLEFAQPEEKIPLVGTSEVFDESEIEKQDSYKPFM